VSGHEWYQLRESAAFYNALFKAEKDDITPENTFFWEINSE
jgi:hypothetical protein